MTTSKTNNMSPILFEEAMSMASRASILRRLMHEAETHEAEIEIIMHLAIANLGEDAKLVQAIHQTHIRAFDRRSEYREKMLKEMSQISQYSRDSRESKK